MREKASMYGKINNAEGNIIGMQDLNAGKGISILEDRILNKLSESSVYWRMEYLSIRQHQ